ncbi:MAG: GGDEF domain-containing protein [Actinobacteria bacterium]|nr:GGDEF domain-containing protein [Actinomycetota bacterium]
MHDKPNSSQEEAVSAPNPLFRKAENVLEANKIRITKDWLGRIISRMDDLDSLESFPTQESIRASVELVEGLAAALRDETVLDSFQPGGHYYERAAQLGFFGDGDTPGLVTLSGNMLALEDSIWMLLLETLRKEDKELLTLVMRLRVALHGIFTASTESYFRHSTSELDRLAHTDPLTGLYNRRFMTRELERHCEMYKRYRHPFSILMLDLDNLKAVNDTHGHQAGDAALKHLAMLLKVNVRDVDIACRLGGDEFIVLMPETEQSVVQVVGDRISTSLAKTKLKVDAALVSLEVSVGDASCPTHGTESDQLLEEADASLYRSKQGRATNREAANGPASR